MIAFLKKLVPYSVKHGLKMRFLRSVLPQLTPMLEDAIRNGATDVLRGKTSVLRAEVFPSLYDPWEGRSREETYFYDSATLKADERDDGLPVPPSELRQGYRMNSSAEYIEDGAVTARHIRQIFEENEAPIDGNSVVLDWGCATGRVLRHFRKEAEGGTFWGTDQDEHCILWARENLCPPFQFVTCTAYPHLPFEDNTFTHIYGISIFTHVIHLVDAWLMELRRILKPGGHLMVTVHTEAATEEFERGYWPPWLETGMDVAELRSHDLSVVTEGTWENSYPFFRAEWLREDWSRFMTVVDLRPAFIPYVQTAVLLRK